MSHRDAPTGLLKTFETILERRESSSARRQLTLAAQDSVDFSSNDFLSLSKSPKLRDTYVKELERASHSHPLGSGGSRLLDGNTAYAEAIEHDLADFYDSSSALLFNSGFDANSGVFSCVPQSGDAIVYDEYIHASVHEGMRLSRAKIKKAFAHNDTTSLASVLKRIVDSDPAIATGRSNVFIAIESVYSMDGDVAPIKDMLEHIRTLLPASNGHLLVDEAHSSGVYGACGRGIVHELGVQNEVLARLHTFGKALSSGGAVLLCHPVMRDYLINYARSLIYTTAMGLPTLAMIRTVHLMLREGETRSAQQRLWNLIQHLHQQLNSLPSTKLLSLASGLPKSPIFSICTPYPRELAAFCQAAGFIVRPIVPPTVPEGSQRVRVCLHAGNSSDDVDRLVRCVSQWISTQDTSPDFLMQIGTTSKL